MPRSPFLLTRLPEPDLPTPLFQNILEAIQRAKLHQLRLRYGLMLCGLMGSVSSIVYTRSNLATEVSSSSFVEFLRLALSDPDIVISHGSDFAWGLLESIPVTTILLLSLGVFFLLGFITIAHMTRNLKRSAFLHHSFS